MKKSQGEIFGIALIFVLVILGVLFYGKFQTLHNIRESGEDSDASRKHQILSETTLNSLLDMSTGCYVERNRDSLQDLISYCVENSNHLSPLSPGPNITCTSDVGIQASCAYAITLLNDSLNGFFNDSGIGKIPFKLVVYMDKSLVGTYMDRNLTNFGDNFNGRIINESNYRKNRYSRAAPGFRVWPTAKRDVTFELYIYYLNI